MGAEMDAVTFIAIAVSESLTLPIELDLGVSLRCNPFWRAFHKCQATIERCADVKVYRFIGLQWESPL